MVLLSLTELTSSNSQEYGESNWSPKNMYNINTKPHFTQNADVSEANFQLILCIYNQAY